MATSQPPVPPASRYPTRLVKIGSVKILVVAAEHAAAKRVAMNFRALTIGGQWLMLPMRPF